MCHYITLVAGGVSEADLDTFMKPRGRKAELLFNASVQRILAPDELHFLTTKGHCDCGTALDHSKVERTESPEQRVGKLRAKGWSQGKIDRWLAAKEKSASREPRASSADSIEFWAELVRDLRKSLAPTSVGLLLHFYSGGLGTEKYTPRRTEVTPPKSIGDALQTMREDELTMLQRAT